MRIELLNSNPDSLKYFFQYIEDHIPKGLSLTPIQIEFGLAKYIDKDYENHFDTDVNVYDYYDENGNTADFHIDDANLLFNDMIFKSKELHVNEKFFTLKPYEMKYSKKTKPPK